MKIKIALKMVMLMVLIVSLVACGSKNTLGKVKDEGEATVGFANEKPYAYQDSNGELTGEAVEIARVILNRIGVEKMEGELTEFGSLIGGLQSKRFDMITAGMFVNPNRCESVLFANPEYSIGEAIGVLKGNPLDIHSYADIAANPDVKVAVMVGAVEIGYLEAMKVPADQIIQVPDQAAAISALQSDRAQVITMTGPSLQAMLESANDSEIERVMDFEQPIVDGESVRGYGATAFHKDDAEFRDAFNKELQIMKDSGELLEILEQFGFTKQELPGDMTAEELCKS